METASGQDEGASTIAAMALTQAGTKSVPLVVEAIEGGETELVRILVSIGNEPAERALDALVANQEEKISVAAQSALTDLRRIRAHQEQSDD